MSEHFVTQTNEMTIINRREIEPLLLKASRVMEFYERAVGCGTSVLDKSGHSIITECSQKKPIFCELCRTHFHLPCRTWEEDEYPCTPLHIKAQERAQKDGSYIYTCDIGLSYWTSPLYAGGRHAGSLIAGQVLAVPRREAVKKFCSRSREVSEKQVIKLMEALPVKTHEEIKALARLLLICARKVSFDAGDLNQTIRTKSHHGKDIPGKKELSAKNNHSCANPQDKERMLLAALRRGDKDTAANILNELLEIFSGSNTEASANFDHLRLWAIELAVLLSRSASADRGLEEMYFRCLRRLQESQTAEELGENLHIIVEHMGSRIFSFQGVQHASALRKAERFIWDNYTRKISLKEIAAASGLSAPYFSTVFKDEMGQNLSSYLNHLRVEKAAAMLTKTGHSLNEIAAACGFKDQSWFSKTFKIHLGMSPGKFREHGNTGGGQSQQES